MGCPASSPTRPRSRFNLSRMKCQAQNPDQNKRGRATHSETPAPLMLPYWVGGNPGTPPRGSEGGATPGAMDAIPWGLKPLAKTSSGARFGNRRHHQTGGRVAIPPRARNCPRTSAWRLSTPAGRRQAFHQGLRLREPPQNRQAPVDWSRIPNRPIEL